MMLILAAFFCLISVPCHAECIAASAAIKGLIENQYSPRVVFELDHSPAIIFSDAGGAWLEFTMPDEKTMCLVRAGRGFALIGEGKA